MPITRSFTKAGRTIEVSKNVPAASSGTMPTTSPLDAAQGTSLPIENIPLASQVPPLIALGSTTSSHASTRTQKLAVRARHARANAEIARNLLKEKERLIEQERHASELELQAELAAIESLASEKSNSTRRWLEETHSQPLYNLNFSPSGTRVRQEIAAGITAAVSADNLVQQPPTTTTHILGTHHPKFDKCSYYNNNKLRNTLNPITKLAEVITDLGKKPKVSCTLPIFSGCASDWLPFKKFYERSEPNLTPEENLARLGAALRGDAREAVSALLMTAADPIQVIRSLELRFGQPEFIICHQIASIRSLPRLPMHESARDLNIFACRLRNCVEVIRELRKPEYFASPELTYAVISKLTPLLRSRWCDYAFERVSSDKSKLEILAEFLEHEASLQIQFGLVSSELTSIKPSQVVKTQCQPVNSKPVKDKVFPYSMSDSLVKPSSSNLCLYCEKSVHSVSDCIDFQSLSLDDRWQWVLDNKVCRRCLKRGSHPYSKCKVRCNVEGCTPYMKHHTLLHKSRSPPADVQAISHQHNEDTDPTTGQSATVGHSTASADLMKPLLKVIPVTLTGPKGSVDTYALLDDGSSATLVDKTVADLLVTEESKVPLQINCIGGLTRLTDVSYINIKIRGRYCSNDFDIRARSISDLGLRTQSVRANDLKHFNHLSDIVKVLAYNDAKPTCLIGTDNWHLLLPQAIRRGTMSEPAAVLTPLGWALFGFIHGKTNQVEFINHAVVEDSDDSKLVSLIKYYYELDSIGIQRKHHRSPNDKLALDILEKTTNRLPSGRFETGLLWRNDIKNIPNSRSLALSRFISLEKKMSKDSTYAAAYKTNVQGMIDKSYAELCTGPPQGSVTWYLPHFSVVHPHKKKLRVVHDAAAKCEGVSLNSLLLSGSDLLQPLLAIIMRFREGRVALTADIREMFPQIKIRAQDRDAQRFFWRNNPQLSLQEYRMSSMIFGATSSPCTALFLKNKNASDFQHLYPEAVRSIIEDHYMDDLLGSVNEAEEAARLALEIITIHKAAGFEMRSWVSNVPEALSLISPEFCATGAAEVGLGPSSPYQTRVLGLTWLVTQDSLCFLKTIPNFPEISTKRSMLSLLMSVYDPLGLITPIVVKGRIIFQKTWKFGLDWDHSLPAVITNKWKSWFHELQSLEGCSIPRCYSGHNVQNISDVQLHVFSDASELAYACVAYWRFSYADGSVQLSLTGGKARLAPLKPTTVPRLELQAALIAARFAAYIKEAHRIEPAKIYMWTDSITVLRWLRSDACAFKPFVSFRVGEISEISDVQNYRYVPTGLNVADDATRDTEVLSMQSRWFSGPSFLLTSEELWPSEPIDNASLIQEERKTASEAVFFTETTVSYPIVADHNRFSKWSRLLRATARVYQAVKMFRSLLPQNSDSQSRHSDSLSRNSNLPYFILSVDELHIAEINLFKTAQLVFSDEISCVNAGRPVSSHSRLKNFSLLIGEDDLLRLSGRTTACSIIESRPIILDGKHPITKLLIHSYHTKFAHANNELVVNELRQRFHVVGLRPAVKKVASRCQECRIRKAKPETPPIGDLPNARMAHHERPFSYVGVDYFGPINVTIGRRTAKRWIALFTCLTVRAVHLEIVESLSSDSAIMALRRFIARRGCPTCIYSDNGTAFVGAAKILPEIYEFASTNQIRWKFIPPSAPFMGGCWERLVKNVKTALTITLTEKSPKEEILMTLLVEAEAVVNSRPLTHVQTDLDSDVALTPFTFLIGTSSNEIQMRQFDDSDLSSRAQWRQSQRLADHFWERFVKEYLPTLVPRRTTPESRALKIGDLVCIADGTLPRRCWPRGRVVATYPGKDGVVRVVDVATKGGVLRRPTRKLALLVAT